MGFRANYTRQSHNESTDTDQGNIEQVNNWNTLVLSCNQLTHLIKLSLWTKIADNFEFSYWTYQFNYFTRTKFRIYVTNMLNSGQKSLCWDERLATPIILILPFFTIDLHYLLNLTRTYNKHVKCLECTLTIPYPFRLLSAN